LGLKLFAQNNAKIFNLNLMAENKLLKADVEKIKDNLIYRLKIDADNE
jgi:uncharacterized protein YcgL (UPF0745 family)